MFAKALYKYKQVFGPEYAKSKTLRDKLYILDAIIKNKALVEIEEQTENVLTGSAPSINKPPLTLKRHKLF
jgi:hypothetical protein